MTASGHISGNEPASPIARYLERYGEPLAVAERDHIETLLRGNYRWVLIVPAFDEPADFLDSLLHNQNFASQQQALLVICVINAPDDAPASARARTLSALPVSSASSAAEVATNPVSLRTHSTGIDVLSIDAATAPLPAEQSTGLARKIGNDIACQLMLRGRIKTLLLCNTDADAVLPADYFRQLARASSDDNSASVKATPAGAFILPFTHHSDDPEQHAAGQLYELYLRRLYSNLAGCGSPYAYPALGSVLAIEPVLYAKSRGFPRRRAGEDFYLLNKIAKLADVVHLTGQPVVLQARPSARVPFGTGPAIVKALERPPAEYPSYAMASYALLKRFYSGFRELGRPVNAKPSVRGPLWPSAWQDPDLLWLLKRLGLPTVLKKLQANHPGATAQRRAVHEWFDALKVVRFLNEARHFHPDESLLGQHNETGHRPTEINRQLESARSITRHGVTQAL